MVESSYKHAFVTPSSAQSYDERVYAPGSSAELLWRIEASIVRQLASEALRGRQHADYLDFACGTGRIISSLEDLADSAVGIDISGAMLERARENCRFTKLICTDITAPDATIEGQYDLITSFRFLTNAENELRAKILRRLHDRLKDNGILIVNTHGNPWSHRAVLLPYHWAKDAARGRPLFGYLSNRQARRLLETAGFRVEKIIGMGFVPGKLLWLFSARAAESIERRLAGKWFIQALGLNQIFVCTKRRDN